MDNKQLNRLIVLLEKYNEYKFCGRDRDIMYLIADIKELLKTN